jgi:DNA-binding GntR family transcriptional regulator
VREALLYLEKEGFLTNVPHKGMMVRKFKYEELKDIYQVRSVLEGLCAFLATENAGASLKEELLRNIELAKKSLAEEDVRRLAKLNSDFHAKITEASGNNLLKQLLDNLRACSSIMRISIWTIPNRPKKALEEHEQIMQAIVGGKKMLAAKRAMDHIINSWKNAQRVLEEEE